MKSYSLHELSVYVKRAIAINFQDYCWVNAEILSVQQSKGHFYLQLVQQNEDNKNIAKCQAILWKNQRQWLIQKHDVDLSDSFEVGKSCNILVDVTFDELFGLQLHIKDIDLNFTLGELEKERRATIQRIEKEKLDQINRQKLLGSVIQRIAIISSKNAAGFVDFCNELEQNEFGLRFQARLFHASMQGQSVLEEFREAIRNIDPNQFDCIVYVRGGGSKFDLSAFDQYELAYEVAHCPLPVITGIGHEIDTSAVDLVAHTAVKTPTAAATFLIGTNQAFVQRIQGLIVELHQYSDNSIRRNLAKLDMIQVHLESQVKNKIQQYHFHLKSLQSRIGFESTSVLQRSKTWLHGLEEIARLSNPTEILKKGYAIVRKNDKYIRSSQEAIKSDRLNIQLADGTIEATVL